MNLSTLRRYATITVLVLVASACLPFDTVAQTSGGSSYSIFNIGDLQGGTSIASSGRAGIETGIFDPANINSMNPAAWSDLRYVTIQTGLNFEQYQVSDGAVSIYQNSSKIREFGFAFPFSDKMGGSAGLYIRPYSTVIYRTQIAQNIPTIDSTTRSEINYSGRGGITQGMIGGSIRPFSWLGIGATANLYFGTIHGASDVGFSSAALNPASYQQIDTYLGFGGSVGITAEPVSGLRLGLAVDLGSDLTHESIQTSSFVQGGREFIDTMTSPATTLSLPPRFSVGASYIAGRLQFAADAILQNWNTGTFATARPWNRFAVGVERLPSSSVNADGFDRWTFRLGAYLDQTYYNLPAGDITQMGATLGARWPITDGSILASSSSLDFGLEAGMRGEATQGLTRELYGKFYIGISLGELWFQRRR